MLVNHTAGKQVSFTTEYLSESFYKSFPTLYTYTKIGERWASQWTPAHLKFEQGVDFGYIGFSSDLDPWMLCDIIVTPNGLQLITDMKGNDAPPYTVVTTDAASGRMVVTLQNCKAKSVGNIQYSSLIGFAGVKVSQQGKDTQILIDIGRNGYTTYYTAGMQDGSFKTTPDTGYMSIFVNFSDQETYVSHLLPEQN